MYSFSSPLWLKALGSLLISIMYILQLFSKVNPLEAQEKALRFLFHLKISFFLSEISFHSLIDPPKMLNEIHCTKYLNYLERKTGKCFRNISTK